MTIDWISLPGASLRLEDKHFVLQILSQGGALIKHAREAGFAPSAEDPFVFRAPLTWDLARAMRRWPGVVRIQVDERAVAVGAPTQPEQTAVADRVDRPSARTGPSGGGRTTRGGARISRNPRHFHLSGEIDREGGFSPKARYLENREAIEALRSIEAEDRDATPKEKSILARFNGWGGLSGALAPQYPVEPWHWKANAWLKEHLTQEELTAARHSVLNAHYTPPGLIREIWSTLDALVDHTRLFERKPVVRILEPSMGVGNFLGLMPERWVACSRIVGVELDPIPARIAGKLYPDADIRACGFEDLRVPDGYFDLVVTNVPFGNYSVHDPEFRALSLSIHDYFLVKALRKTAPGGILAVISSAFTMDKRNDYVRALLAEQAGFLGGVRLPEIAQSAQAGTRVTTDILLFAKPPVPGLRTLDAESWLQTRSQSFKNEHGETTELALNGYFLDHPERVLGQLYAGRGIHGVPRLDVRSQEGVDWMGCIASGLLDGVRVAPDAQASDAVPDAPPPDAGEGSAGRADPGTEFFIGPLGRVYRRYPESDGESVGESEDDSTAPGVPVDLSGKALSRVCGMIRVRDAMNDLVLLETAYADDEGVRSAMVRLNEVYDDFVKVHGSLNSAVNRRLFRDDPSAGRLAALERVDLESGVVHKADIFSKRIIQRARAPDHVETPIEALNVSMAEIGWVSPERIAQLCNRPVLWVVKELIERRAIFRNPVSDRFEIAAQYLSGDVRGKLEDARSAAKIDGDGRWDPNINALAAVIPQDIGPADISVSMGSTWIPEKVLCGFAREKLDLSLVFTLNPVLKTWDVEFTNHASRNSLANKTTWGTSRRTAAQIVERICNHQSVAIYDSVETENGRTRILNEKETLLAEQKLTKISEAFAGWIWSDPQRTERLVRIYNDRFNSYVAPKYDGSLLTFPGMSASIHLRDHQKNAVVRSILDGNTVFAHQVGTGKTYAMIASAMEWIRVGKASKVGIIVPNHMLEQIEREALQLYPNARILVVRNEDLSRERRARFLGKVSNNQYDIVVMTHSMFTRIPVSAQFESQAINREIARYTTWTEHAKVQATRQTLKTVERRIARLNAKIRDRMSALKKQKERGIVIDDLGIDALFVDEAHNFKNLEADTGRASELAAGIQGSNRAFDLYLKTKWLYERRASVSGVVFSTGTPVSNNLLELFNLQRYIQPQLLDAMGVDQVSSWASTFLSARRRWEPDPGGTGFVMRTRFVLVNAPELLAMLRLNLDVVATKDAGIKVPEVETHNIVAMASERQQEKMEELAARVLQIREREVDPSEDNLLKIISEGRQLALDPRLLSETEAPAYVERNVLKWEKMAENVHRIWAEHTETKSTQIVFCDLGTPSDLRKGRFNIYDAVREHLIERGIPATEIAFIHEAKTDKAKGDLLARVRSGSVRVILGSTSKMGEGTNMQNLACAIHHLDAPWRPSDIEQRDGRIVRQGNRFEKIARYIYTTKGVGFDEYTWTVLKTKAEAFSSILRGEPGVRVFDNDVDPSYAETVAITTGNPLLLEKLDVERELAKSRALARGHDQEQWRVRMDLGNLKDSMEEDEELLAHLKALPEPDGTYWSIDLSGFEFKEGKAPFKPDEDPGLFDIPRTKFLDLLRNLPTLCTKSSHSQMDRIDSARFAGIPVILEYEIDPSKHQRIGVWKLGSMVFRRASDLEAMVVELGDRIAGLNGRIAYLHDEIAKTEEIVDQKNPYNRQVAEWTAKLESVERRMMESVQSDPANEMVDGQGFAPREGFAVSHCVR
jgi:N12 class adenine-specific DNA methylase